ncbi:MULTISPECIES: CAAD domain-containing protein [Nostoc]|uniref:CAAD domain-containing protein n=1 Tax=Nostoc paludosum FACHB-159 TaxID=2692908 RepID=A0ABR8K6R4_9NOSO|nr:MULTISPECIES: CAAD domain-containing protein [Nostoc]MBD2676703.1 CAAD domain-containing protein [Nostoc sp. FACHB-857]MBD2735182.1 CAAD domain-containing protein [Nostoc paludosum FACHB-159]
METRQQPLESINPSSLKATLALEGTNTTNLPKLPPASEPEWQRISRQVFEFFGQLPQYLSSFFKDYSQALITLSLIFAALVTAKVALAVLDAINDIPLLSPFFELVGISYATWFTFRYLIKASNRQELAQQIQLLKNEFVGE